MRDEELTSKKAQYISTTSDLTVQFWSCISTKMTSSFGIQYTYMIGANVTRSINSGLTKNLASFNRATPFFQAQATYGCLLDRACCRQSDQISNSGREKCLVSSCYSSAVEFPTAITDTLREQQRATQIPASSRATCDYRANSSTVSQN